MRALGCGFIGFVGMAQLATAVLAAVTGISYWRCNGSIGCDEAPTGLAMAVLIAVQVALTPLVLLAILAAWTLVSESDGTDDDEGPSLY